LAAAFLAAGFFAGAFLAAGFLAAAFFAGAFFAAAFLAGAAFFAGAFFAAAFLAGAFLAGAFFAAAFLAGAAFFAGAFFAAAFLAGAFLAGAFFAAAFLAGAFLAGAFFAVAISISLIKLQEAPHPIKVRRFTTQRCTTDKLPSVRCGEFRTDREVPALLWRRSLRIGKAMNQSRACVAEATQSQDRAPPVWYSMTRVSKKLRSFFRSIISLIQGKGFSSLGNSSSNPIWVARRLAM